VLPYELFSFGLNLINPFVPFSLKSAFSSLLVRCLNLSRVMLSEAAFKIICVTSSRSFSDGTYLIAFSTFCNSVSVKYSYSDSRHLSCRALIAMNTMFSFHCVFLLNNYFFASGGSCSSFSVCGFPYGKLIRL